MNFLKSEPALVAGAVMAVVAVVFTFVTGLTGTQHATIDAAVIAVLSVILRQKVSPA